MNVIDPHHNFSWRLIAAFFLASMGSWLPVNAQVIISGVVTQNTTLTRNNNPYVVVQDLIVPAGITLTIEPGTIIQFQTAKKLKVRGTLVAKGNIQDSIYFKGVEFPSDAQWWGIEFDSCSTVIDTLGNYVSGNILSYASIYHTSYSVSISGNSGILIEHSLIRNSDDGIVLWDAEHCLIRHCKISNTGLGVFFASGSTSNYNVFEDNVITNNFFYGITINNCGSKVQYNTFNRNRVEDNYIGVYIGNEGLPDIGHNYVTNNIIINNTLEGARIHQDSITFSGNFVLNNDIGLTLKLSKGSMISENVFNANASYAIQITDSACNNSVKLNNISRNGGGVRINAVENKPSVNNTFLTNTIYQNLGHSFWIECGPQGPILFNNFYLNGDTNSFVNESEELITAENNWWGTESNTLIDQMIYDVFDDFSRGLVRYKLPLGQTDTIAPIMPPRNVVKRQAGADVLVSWDTVPVSDLAGYFVYFGNFDGFSFSHRINVGNVTSMLLPMHSVFDSIAVSAFDTYADSLNDQSEGHESEYVFAALSPYAGPDTTLCLNSTLYLDKAKAFNYESINWSTSGDGSFSGLHLLKTTYVPGPLDYLNKQVTLTFNITGVGFNISDVMKVLFSEPPFAFAGADTLLLSDTSYNTSSALAGSGSSIRWISSGDGFFNNDSVLITEYRPGIQDLANGSVILTLQSVSACGSATDDIYLSVLQSCAINGKIHAGDLLAGGSRMQLYRVTEDTIYAERSSLITTDGLFSFKHLLTGDYYIYGIPEKSLFPGYAPSYYYDKLHWKNAFRLSITENTYDVDINLQKLAIDLPEGQGSISGRCFASLVSGQQCGNIVVLLYDKTAKYLLGWTLVDQNGDYSFPGLPFGDYLLVGEKAGYERFFSQMITLSPEHPVITDAQLHIEPFKISFIIPSEPQGPASLIRVFPMPVKDFIQFFNLPYTGQYRIIITGSNGKSMNTDLMNNQGEPCLMDVSDLASGLYVLRIYSGDVFLQTIKIIKL